MYIKHAGKCKGHPQGCEQWINRIDNFWHQGNSQNYAPIVNHPKIFSTPPKFDLQTVRFDQISFIYTMTIVIQNSRLGRK